MSSNSRPSSPVPSVTEGSGPSKSAPAPAPPHEVAAALTDATVPAGTSPSPSLPVHPTVPSKDAFSSNHDHEDLHRGSDELELELSAEAEAEADPHPDTDRELRRTPSPSAMSKAEELKPTAGPHLEAEEHEPDSSDVPSVIDISGPPRDDRTQDGDHEKNEDEDGEEEVGLDTELTIRIDGNDGPESEAKPRPSDATEADAKAHTDAGSTLYGSFAAAGEHVHEHPLSLDTPSSRRRMKGDEEMGEYEYDEEDEDEEDDLGLGGAMGRGGRESPRGFVLTSGKVGGVQMQEFANKPSLGRPRIPHSAYYFGPPPPDAAYGTDPVGQIGVHHPREIVRVERDYSGGELPQFAPTYPLELEGRITPTQFLETINAINEILISAHSLGYAFIDNALAYFTLQMSRAVKKTHHDKEMGRLKDLIDGLNVEMYNPVGLHIKWPRDAAFLFLEIEYY